MDKSVTIRQQTPQLEQTWNTWNKHLSCGRNCCKTQSTYWLTKVTKHEAAHIKYAFKVVQKIAQISNMLVKNIDTLNKWSNY